MTFAPLSITRASPVVLSASLRFPIIIDVDAIPVKPYVPITSTYPKPRLLTGPRSYIQVFRMRHKLVVLDSGIASLYGVTLTDVNRVAMRNACCFPRSNCFRLTNDEWHHLRKITDAEDRGDWLCAPLAFTSDGALAIANILDTFDATRGSVLVWKVIHRLQQERSDDQEQSNAEERSDPEERRADA